MIAGKKLDHIGLASNHPEEDAKFYEEVMGFHLKGKFPNGDGTVYFMENDHGTIYEIYKDTNATGKIDHIAYESTDIEADFKEVLEKGYIICTNGVEHIDTFWANGIRYFKIKSPGGEEVEFCQIL